MYMNLTYSQTITVRLYICNFIFANFYICVANLDLTKSLLALEGRFSQTVPNVNLVHPKDLILEYGAWY